MPANVRDVFFAPPGTTLLSKESHQLPHIHDYLLSAAVSRTVVPKRQQQLPKRQQQLKYKDRSLMLIK